ncbi:MAG: hypothetical protein CVV02_18025 [Firmicutes bacterium HGW-Firmicutes-7]|nr:MAG: hypothetical protein CVV02_18025 [Firmicutes bacterium HGW-Firmicutes-7]
MLKTRYLKNVVASIIAICIIALSFSSINAVIGGKYINNANTLQTLGLFKGTQNGFELTKTSTRAEAAVMLVRLLGKETQATQEYVETVHPFTDVPTWANPYINYLYSTGLTKGISEVSYGSGNQVTGNEYTTMLLRALGYNDQEGLYKWDESLEYSISVGLLNQQELTALKPTANKALLRDEMVKLSYKSLTTSAKGMDKILVEDLLAQHAISADNLNKATKTDKELARAVNINNTENVEMRAVWISYLELQKIFAANKSEKEFQQTIKKYYDNINGLGLNTVIVQVRPFSDAIYPSKYYPWSYIINGKEGIAPSFDPFKIMVDEAHKQGLKIEAWINPFRIRAAGSKAELSSVNKAILWQSDGSNRVIKINEGTFFNPANQEVRTLITQGVVELIDNYDVDGIHFDDYFYPSTDLSYDKLDYDQYTSSGGKLSQQDWRRENVNLLVKGVYSQIKERDPSVQFGISPQGSFEANYNQQFIDTEKWLANGGYVDYICPQIYFGYNHSKYPYSALIEKWDKAIKNDNVKLYIGIAAYKIGREDNWAGNGKREWIEDKRLLQTMTLDARQKKNYGGFILYRYDYLFKSGPEYVEQMNDEIEGLKSILQ